MSVCVCVRVPLEPMLGLNLCFIIPILSSLNIFFLYLSSQINCGRPSGISRITKYIRTHALLECDIRRVEIYQAPWPVTFLAGPVMIKVYLLAASVA